VFALAIVKQQQLTLPGKFVLASIADTTPVKLLKDFCAITGIKSEYVQVSLERV
jgi:hypothetical protein